MKSNIIFLGNIFPIFKKEYRMYAVNIHILYIVFVLKITGINFEEIPLLSDIL